MFLLFAGRSAGSIAIKTLFRRADAVLSGVRLVDVVGPRMARYASRTATVAIRPVVGSR